MSININSVVIGGYLTRDPEIRRVGDRAVASFSVALNHHGKGPDGERRDTVTFVDGEAWGRTAELIGQYLVKGSCCVMEGRLKLDTWKDGEGKSRQKLKVVVDHVQFVGMTSQEPTQSESTEPTPRASISSGRGKQSGGEPRRHGSQSQPRSPGPLGNISRR